jgi:hypothetical protein
MPMPDKLRVDAIDQVAGKALDELIVKTVQRQGMDGGGIVPGHLTPYQDYRLVLIRDGEETCLADVDGYDGFWSHVRDKKEVLAEIGAEVEKFEKIFGVKATGVRLKKTVITTEEWVVDDLYKGEDK